MSTFSAARASEPVTPLWRKPIPPSAFADGANKPTEPRLVGLRLLPGETLQAIRTRAAQNTTTRLKAIRTDDPVWIETFNADVMLSTILCALCHPDDVHRDYWTAQQTVGRTAFSPGGIEYLWDELEELKIKTSPTSPEASAEDIEALRLRFKNPAFDQHVMAGDRRALRRMLRHALDMLEAYDPPKE